MRSVRSNDAPRHAKHNDMVGRKAPVDHTFLDTGHRLASADVPHRARRGAAYHPYCKLSRSSMAKSVDAVVEDALQLTAEERAHVADKLLASLSGDPAIEQAWATEVERRLDEIESGRDRLIPAADAIARARAALKRSSHSLRRPSENSSMARFSMPSRRMPIWGSRSLRSSSVPSRY